jgi:mRNA interferase HigB
MRIITERRLREYARRYPTARTAISAWVRVVRQGSWQNIQELRRVFPTADAVVVKSGRIVTVFNVCGNQFRLIVAIHYNTQLVFILRFFTHAEYDKDAWKASL